MIFRAPAATHLDENISVAEDLAGGNDIVGDHVGVVEVVGQAVEGVEHYLEGHGRGGVLGRQALGLLGRGGALAGGQEVLDEDSLRSVHLVGGQEAGRVGRTVAHDLPAPRPEQGVHGLTVG